MPSAMSAPELPSTPAIILKIAIIIKTKVLFHQS
jgi:hypothetical protein